MRRFHSGFARLFWAVGPGATRRGVGRSLAFAGAFAGASCLTPPPISEDDELSAQDVIRDEDQVEVNWEERGKKNPYSVCYIYEDYKDVQLLARDNARTVVCLFDGTASSKAALDEAMRAKKPSDKLVILFAVGLRAMSEFIFSDDHVQMTENDVLNASRLSRGMRFGEVTQKYLTAKYPHVHNVQITLLSSLLPKMCAVDYLNEIDAKVVYCGYRGVGMLYRALMGSFSHYILHHSECSVMIAKSREEKLRTDQARRAEAIDDMEAFMPL